MAPTILHRLEIIDSSHWNKRVILNHKENFLLSGSWKVLRSLCVAERWRAERDRQSYCPPWTCLTGVFSVTLHGNSVTGELWVFWVIKAVVKSSCLQKAPFVKLVMSSSISSYNELVITNSGFERCEVCCWGLELGVVVGDSRAVKV
jgi:hypothetical protein